MVEVVSTGVSHMCDNSTVSVKVKLNVIASCFMCACLLCSAVERLQDISE